MDGERLREAREAAGLSQRQLAAVAGVSRQLVGAVEAGRNLPRVDFAVALARALGRSVEELCGPSPAGAVRGVLGAAPPPGSLVQIGRVGDHLVCAPAPIAGSWWVAADAVMGDDAIEWLPAGEAGGVLVGCDPAIGLAGELLSRSGRRLLAVPASTAAATRALAEGRAHAAVVHAPTGSTFRQPTSDVHRVLLATWRVGLATSRGARRGWAQAALAGRRKVVQREDGATAQTAFATAVEGAGGSMPPGPRATGHLEAARWADERSMVAVTIEPAAVGLGLDFHPLETHEVQLWIASAHRDHPAMTALGELLSTASFQQRLSAVGGYDLTDTGSTAS